MKQILINLVSNAVKFTDRDRSASRRRASVVADAATLVEIVVADTGIGIAEQDLARMFQPFEQLDAGARAGGTGLGLAISLAYARLMGGDLSVESAPGAGAGSSSPSWRSASAGAGARASSDRHVASRQRRDAIEGAHRRRRGGQPGCPRGVARAERLRDAHGRGRTAALSIHADWRPDVVLMDLRMPGMNGLEAIRRLRAAGSKAAIGALTAGAFGDDEREALRVGADFFIRKPYDDRELLDGLARVLEARVAYGQRPSGWLIKREETERRSVRLPPARRDGARAERSGPVRPGFRTNDASSSASIDIEDTARDDDDLPHMPSLVVGSSEAARRRRLVER